MEKRAYKTIACETVVEQEIQKSKFITYLKPVQTEAEAKDYLKSIKKMHPKAVHHCSAFIVGPIERSNDDGEPSSSAGLPMLQTLRGHDMQFVIAVVVRYFGGILLGVGGLIRAYGSSVKQAIEVAEILVPQNVFTYELSFPYRMINDIEVLMSEAGEILDRRYEALVVYDVQVLKPENLDCLQDVTKGEGVLRFKNERVELVKEI